VELRSELSGHATSSAIEHERVEVQIRIERTSKSLREDDRSRARMRDAAIPGSTFEKHLHAAREDAPHGAPQRRILGEQVGF